jgi:hypothetical protein
LPADEEGIAYIIFGSTINLAHLPPQLLNRFAPDGAGYAVSASPQSAIIITPLQLVVKVN